jgi:Xaa-Pro aminopeptidase
VVEAIGRAGLVTDHPPVVAFQRIPRCRTTSRSPGADLRLEAGRGPVARPVGGAGQRSVFADQTWMAFAGRAPDAEVLRVWSAVQRARDAVVAVLRARYSAGVGKGGDVGVSGADLDDVARGVIRDAGYGQYFVHRTGHSIDRDLHGSGPNLDNFETADTRTLIPGIGFSVEPGIYLPGRFGMRSEMNVYLGETGPELTPPAPQQELLLV